MVSKRKVKQSKSRSRKHKHKKNQFASFKKLYHSIKSKYNSKSNKNFKNTPRIRNNYLDIQRENDVLENIFNWNKRYPPSEYPYVKDLKKY